MKQIVLFAFAGMIGYLVDAGALLAASAHVGPYLGRLISFAAAVLATWVINRSLTFRHERGSAPVHREFSRYFLVALCGGAVNIGSYALLVYQFHLLTYLLPVAVAFGSLAGMMVNFWLSKRFVFNAMPVLEIVAVTAGNTPTDLQSFNSTESKGRTSPPISQ